jgi:hypothetical protein
MGSVELVPVEQKYSTEYKINPNNISQVIFENTIKTIHQVWNNTNGKYILTLYTTDGRHFDFTQKSTNIYTFENRNAMETINAFSFDIESTENNLLINTRDFVRAVVRRV